MHAVAAAAGIHIPQHRMEQIGVQPSTAVPLLMLPYRLYIEQLPLLQGIQLLHKCCFAV
jgi:hypothetical protein